MYSFGIQLLLIKFTRRKAILSEIVQYLPQEFYKLIFHHTDIL